MSHNLEARFDKIQDALTLIDRKAAELERDVVQLAARLQSLRSHLRDRDWKDFVLDHPHARDWFDEDGVPILPSAKKPDDEH